MLEIASQLSKVNTQLLAELEAEARDAAVGWLKPFHEYTSDGASIVTLWNATGQDGDFNYPDSLETLKTPQLKRLPAMDKFLSESGLQIISSYISYLDGGAFLHEHRDFVLQKIPRVRLHIPLVTHDQAFIVVPGKRIHFRKGFIWKFDPRKNLHSAFNSGKEERIHLLIDCFPNKKTQALLAEEWLDNSLVIDLPLLTDVIREKMLEQAEHKLKTGTNKDAEEILLKSFCQYNLGGINSYDLLFELYENKPEYQERLQYWHKHKEEEVLLELA